MFVEDWERGTGPAGHIALRYSDRSWKSDFIRNLRPHLSRGEGAQWPVKGQGSIPGPTRPRANASRLT